MTFGQILKEPVEQIMKRRRNAFQQKTADIKGMRGDFAWYVQGTVRRPERLGQNEGKGCGGDEV